MSDMKTVIDCDGVFEILTRAPFPTGSGCDGAVEAHLGVCHECRRLAEALRPAIGLFHESLEHSESLPEYDGKLANKASPFSLGRRRSVNVGPLVAAGLAACLVVWLFQSASLREQNVRNSSRQTVSAAPTTEGLATLTALNLSLSCLTKSDAKANRLAGMEVSAKPIATAAELRFLCCSHCHRPGGTGPASARAIAAVEVACVSCHRRTEEPRLG
jgi:organic hydroperoxide reductase OsmC/OhrA